MNNIKKILLLLVIVFTMLPCIASSNDFMDRAISSWYGYSLDSFIEHWGYPDRASNFAGYNLYHWDLVKSIQTNYNSYSSSSYEKFCSVTIEVDEAKNIKNGQYKGNDCPFSYLLNADSYVNPNNDPWKIEKQLRQAKKQSKKNKSGE